ncbi:MAG: iron transporter [Gammaproteobacteria bacterium]|jgi:Fe-S cluster biosynthesis and repair protein YggX|nr:iron transporter [Gammaproteobacteria bacterium]
MSHDVFCEKLGRKAPGLDFLPYPGALGQRIYDSISKEAWGMWLRHQTMLINEYRLSTLEPQAREFLAAEMQKFLFGEGSERPAGFVEPEKK